MRRLAWLGRESSRRAGQTRGGPRRGRLRGAVTGGLAAAVAVVGLVAFATPAFAQDNVITATVSCASPLGSGAQITWTIANGFNLAETGTVTTVTGGLSTLDAPAFSIVASPGQPSQTATLTQTLPAGTTGVITLDVSSTWSNGASETGSGTFDLSMIGCAAPVQSIAGHIYLCHGGNPTTDEETGGMLGVDGTGLSTVPPTLNPLAPADVIAGSYSMTASSPPGFQLVACGGSSSPNAAGTSATESVDVPSGGAGVGVFYAAPSSPPASVPAGTATNSVTPATAGGSVTPTITANGPGHADHRDRVADAGHADGLIGLDRLGQAVHLAREDGQHQVVFGPGHPRDLLLQGDQHGQRHAGPGDGDRPHGGSLAHLVPRHLPGPLGQRDLHGDLHHHPGRRGPRLSREHRHRHGHPAGRATRDGPVLGVHPGLPVPVDRAKKTASIKSIRPRAPS